MAEYLGEHWVMYIISSIVLGIIGSGMWDALVKPYGSKFSAFTFQILTLGAKKSRDRIYLEASDGLHEVASLYCFLIIATLIFALAAFSISLNFKLNELTDNIEKCRLIEDEGKKKDCLIQLFKEEKSSQFSIFELLILIFPIYLFRRHYVINKSNLVVTHFTKALKIIRPVIGDNDYYDFEQMMALMKTKDDYDLIVEKLNNIANKNKLTLPPPYF